MDLGVNASSKLIRLCFLVAFRETAWRFSALAETTHFRAIIDRARRLEALLAVSGNRESQPALLCSAYSS